MINQLRTAFHEEKNLKVQSAIAVVLSDLHSLSHEIYKADELARSVTQKHRDTHPAPNAAANAIVMYPTNRPGAPGFMQ